MKFFNKKVLVTGGARRIGALISMRFAELGACVTIHANSHYTDALSLANNLPGHGHSAVQADFNRIDDIEDLVAKVYPIDILINNASLYRHFDSSNSPEYASVNYNAPKILIDAMLRQHNETMVVINIIDQIVIASKTGSADSYLGSRMNLARLTTEYAMKFGPYNMRINAVAPGAVMPPPEIQCSDMRKSIATMPLRRKVSADDLIDSIVFLCSNESITGAILPVDCGQHCARSLISQGTVPIL